MAPISLQLKTCLVSIKRVQLLLHRKLQIVLFLIDQQVAKFLLTGDNSLYILLPNTNTLTDLQKVERGMTDGNVRQMIRQLNAASPQSMEVTLPQIKLNAEPDMIALLKKLGLLILCVSSGYFDVFLCLRNLNSFLPSP